MPGLVLNGIEVPVEAGSWDRAESEELGERGRSSLGRSFSSVRVRKTPWSGRTTPLLPAEVLAWTGLIRGLGDAWRFDAGALTSVHGRAKVPESAYGSFTLGAPVAPWGTSGVCTGFYYYPVRRAQSWTLIARYLYGDSWTAGTIRRSDGRWFRGGALYVPASYEEMTALDYDAALGRVKIRARIKSDGSAPHPLWAAGVARVAGDYCRNSLVGGLDLYFICTVGGVTGGVEPVFNRAIGATTADNTVTWRCLGEWPTHLADLVFLPFAVPDAWIASIETEHDARPWTFPTLRATGSLVAGAPRTVSGQTTGTQPQPVVSSGTFEPGAASLGFELREA